MRPERVRIRSRRPDDLPALASALLAQQPETRYPFRDPLPVPVETFLHADDAVGAWTAELDGDPVGHVCHVGAPRLLRSGEPVLEVCAQAHGCEPVAHRRRRGRGPRRARDGPDRMISASG